jgi:hypothetical protein
LLLCSFANNEGAFCFVDFKGFFEFALQNATDTLQTQGKVVGKNVKPFTIEEPGVAAS